MADAPVVLVTGGASGIGRACAERFAVGGWRVAVADLDAPGARAVATAVQGASVSPADVARPAACDAAVAATLGWAGRLDCLVNAAGVWHEGPAEAVTEDDWDHVLAVNLKGTFFMTRAALPHLRATRGAVVNLASDAGIQGNRGAAVYCASKGGVVLLTKALALDLAPDGVRVNALCPGDVDTPMLHGQAHRHGGDPGTYLHRLLDAYPQDDAARFIDPSEVAELAWFLAQPAARSITGAALPIDNGLSAGVA